MNLPTVGAEARLMRLTKYLKDVSEIEWVYNIVIEELPMAVADIL